MDLFSEAKNWIPVAVVIASFLGSGHCVSMCGGLLISTVKSRADWLAYHCGRLAGYMLWGAAAGALGSSLFSSPGATHAHQIASIIVTALMAMYFVLSGIAIWRGRALHFSLIPRGVFPMLANFSQQSALAMGLMTAILPCGWLHSFVLGAVATQSPWRGAVFMLMFGIGTLPALGVTPWVFRQVWNPALRKFPKISAIIFIAVGALTLNLKMKIPVAAVASDTTDKTPAHHCH